MKRWVAILCCTVLLCCLLAGCNKTPAALSSALSGDAAADTPAADMLALAFNKEDTLDPFSAKTQLNICLSTLLYNSLVTLDADFMPQNAMATVEQTDTTHIKATLKANLQFSDGSAVTAADVVYSFNQAKGSDNYKTRLSGFTSAAGKGKTVTFTLSGADNYASACLNFPIIKKDTATTEAAKAPIGSGTYIYHADTAALTLNAKAADAGQVTIRTIALRHLVSNAAVLQALENGSIQFMFNDLSHGDIPRTTVQDKAVDLTQLVYIGVNGSRALLNTAAYRKALSSALDRTAIAAAAYAGRAHAATSPFHPKWKPASGLSCMNTGSDTDAAVSLARQALTAPTAGTTASAGGTTVGTTAKATSTASTAATGTTSTTTATAARTLTMIYPSGNSCREAAVKMMVSQFSAAGITVTATPLAYSEYMNRLKAGNYDLYLGEIRLSPNMDLSPFLRAGGTAAYGVNAGGDSSAKYTAFKDGSSTAAAFVTAFGEEMPYIPLYWRQGMVACADPISDITPSAYNLFDGIK